MLFAPGFGVCRIGAEKWILGNSDLVWGLGFGVYDFREFRFSFGFRVWGLGHWAWGVLARFSEVLGLGVLHASSCSKPSGLKRRSS